jgi:hypothetical protein
MIRVICPECKEQMSKVGPDTYICENPVCESTAKFNVGEEGLNPAGPKYF